MYEIMRRSHDGVVGLRAAGELGADETRDIRHALERRYDEHGKLRVVARVEDFQGFASFAALWQDLKTDNWLRIHVERLAVVGGNRADEWMTRIGKALTDAELRYFPLDEAEKAWQWVEPPGRAEA